MRPLVCAVMDMLLPDAIGRGKCSANPPRNLASPGELWLRSRFAVDRDIKVLKIAARAATFVAADLHRRGIAVEPVLQAAGMRPADIADPDARVPYDALLRLIERAADVTGEAS